MDWNVVREEKKSGWWSRDVTMLMMMEMNGGAEFKKGAVGGKNEW